MIGIAIDKPRLRLQGAEFQGLEVPERQHRRGLFRPKRQLGVESGKGHRLCGRNLRDTTSHGQVEGFNLAELHGKGLDFGAGCHPLHVCGYGDGAEFRNPQGKGSRNGSGVGGGQVQEDVDIARR